MPPSAIGTPCTNTIGPLTLTSMNIHEQIIAFLDGELRDESQVAELLHVLAVAPEKQRLLIDQVRIRRSFATLGGGLASPLAADAAILQGLHAIDAGFPSAGLPPGPPASAAPATAARLFRYSPVLMGSVAALLITVGGVIGYIFGSGGTARSNDLSPLRDRAAVTAPLTPGGQAVGGVTAGSAPTSSGMDRSITGSAPASLARNGGSAGNGSDGTIAALRDSLARLRSRYASLLAADARASRRLTSVSAPVATAPMGPAMLARRDEGSSTREALPTEARPLVSRVAPRAIDGRSPAIAAATFGEMESPRGMDGRPLTDADLAVPDRVWQLGMRSNFRISFPRIYGVETRNNALTDREVVLTRRFGAGAMGLQMPMRMGIAVGGTQFSESFHTNTGGQQIDTIIAQTPSFIYGRGFIAPELVSSENFGASLELGGGGTAVGPFATVGLGLEYRALDRVSVDVGLSSCLLWTKLEQQAIMSTNLNAHVGAAMWFSFDELFK